MTKEFFVYGTLRSGQINFTPLQDICVSVTPGEVKGDLFDLGPYPVALMGEGVVKGEWLTFEAGWDEAVTKYMDMIEGYTETSPETSLYIRTEVEDLNGGHKGFMYFGGEGFIVDEDLIPVPGGDWVLFKEQERVLRREAMKKWLLN